ncbi:MAG TPA: DHH family phosphoesterase [Acidobacteriaceae bacterium]|jgi:phosphoesterase RecJ-like protein|nr:DHH family phosphoesterase [Acidobacteriaceae bacterium]
MAAGQDIPSTQQPKDSAGLRPGGARETPHAVGLQGVLDVLRSGRRFAICSHARPDGDAVGAMLASGMLLAQLRKQAELFSADPVPMIYRGLPCAASIRPSKKVEGNFDAVILLECDGVQRSRLAGLEGRLLVNIDHHASGRPFADVNWIDLDACAVAEMVHTLAHAAGAEITPDMATCLYAGLLTDTGSFCYQGTDAHAFELAQELVRRGANPAEIAREVYFSNPLSKMLLLGAALSNLRRDGRLAWLWVTHADMTRTGAAEEDCEGIVNYAIGISGVEGAVLLRELPDHRVRLSLRSKGRLDVARIASAFGGGGHRHAGGCTLDGPLSAAMDKILETMRRELMTTVTEEIAITKDSDGNLVG